MCTKYRRRIFKERYGRRPDWIDAVLFVVTLLLLWAAVSPKAEAADARLMLNIVSCESAFDSHAVGDDGVSRGIAQFRKETFYEFATLAIRQGKWDYKRLGRPKWMNPMQQMFLLEWGIDNGYGNRWTCYRNLTGGKR